MQQAIYRMHRNKQLAQGHQKRDTLKTLYPTAKAPYYCCEFCRQYEHIIRIDIWEGLAYCYGCMPIVKALSLGEGIN